MNKHVVQRRLAREIKHQVWLERNLPCTRQLRQCKLNIFKLRTQLLVEMKDEHNQANST